jgi:hypothetical protein
MLDGGVQYKNLNDPLFTAAEDLGTRSIEKRKVIVILTDGQVVESSLEHFPFDAPPT